MRVCVYVLPSAGAYHLCTQVHLCLAGGEAGGGAVSEEDGLLSDPRGSRVHTLSTADQLGCSRGGG